MLGSTWLRSVEGSLERGESGSWEKNQSTEVVQTPSDSGLNCGSREERTNVTNVVILLTRCDNRLNWGGERSGRTKAYSEVTNRVGRTVVPSEGKTGREGKLRGQSKFCFGYAEFEMAIGHPSGDVSWVSSQEVVSCSGDHNPLTISHLRLSTFS